MNSRFLLSFSFFLSLVAVVYALQCYTGDADFQTTTDCDPSINFCVIYQDWIYLDTYLYCDSTSQCSEVGFKNTSDFGLTCCSTSLCNNPNTTKLVRK
ncbi:hypothetical protein M3Y99_01813100 [Aphelenchoides fujianensis]|nr:hypothetical protein M3Y99_01813100 [Aphelenchoides fujianensis]